jgi:hypothetical protein
MHHEEADARIGAARVQARVRVVTAALDERRRRAAGQHAGDRARRTDAQQEPGSQCVEHAPRAIAARVVQVKRLAHTQRPRVSPSHAAAVPLRTGIRRSRPTRSGFRRAGHRMLITSSHVSRVSRRMPSPSAPITIATGPSSFVSYSVPDASSAVPMIHARVLQLAQRGAGW